MKMINNILYDEKFIAFSATNPHIKIIIEKIRKLKA